MAQKATPQKENVLKFDQAFSTYSINDVEAAKSFYADKLGIEVEDQKEGGVSLKLGGQNVYLYPKDEGLVLGDEVWFWVGHIDF